MPWKSMTAPSMPLGLSATRGADNAVSLSWARPIDVSDEFEKVRRYAVYRAAQAAFRRQDLATAIKEWGRVLELDPNNELARARRQEAIDLERRLKQMK